MKLVTIAAHPDGRTGVLVGDDVLDFALAAAAVPLAGWVPTAMPALLAGGDEGLDIVKRILGTVDAGRGSLRDRLRESGALRPLKDVKLMAPVPRAIVLSHGRAYLSHRKEMQKTEKPRMEEHPTGFIKNVNSVIGPGAPIPIPPQCPDQIDWEGEFSVVFGKPCHNVTEAEALDYVAGYTLINDVSARNWVKEFQTTGNAERNRMGKQLPGFCPLGPVVATRDEVPDPHNVDLKTMLNGEVMQSANTSDLIWTIPFLISYFAQWYPFMPGDVLTTGSPPGVGYGRDPKIFMKPGDVIEVSATGVGTLSNTVVAAKG